MTQNWIATLTWSTEAVEAVSAGGLDTPPLLPRGSTITASTTYYYPNCTFWRAVDQLIKETRTLPFTPLSLSLQQRREEVL